MYMRTHSLSSRHNPISFVLRLTSWCVLVYVIRKNFNVSLALKILTYNASGLLISKFALWKLFRYLINCAGVTRQNRFLRNHDFWVTPINIISNYCFGELSLIRFPPSLFSILNAYIKNILSCLCFTFAV